MPTDTTCGYERKFVFLVAFLSFAKLKLPLSLHKVSITKEFKSYIIQAHVIQELKMSLKGFEIEI